jgi:hypothetical protein
MVHAWFLLFSFFHFPIITLYILVGVLSNCFDSNGFGYFMCLVLSQMHVQSFLQHSYHLATCPSCHSSLLGCWAVALIMTDLVISRVQHLHGVNLFSQTHVGSFSWLHYHLTAYLSCLCSLLGYRAITPTLWNLVISRVWHLHGVHLPSQMHVESLITLWLSFELSTPPPISSSSGPCLSQHCVTSLIQHVNICEWMILFPVTFIRFHSLSYIYA